MASERAIRAVVTQAGVLAAGACAAWAGTHGLYATALTAALGGGVLAFGRLDGPLAVAPARLSAETPVRPLEVPLLRALLNEAPAPLLLLEGGGSVRAVNRAAREVFDVEDRLPRPTPELLQALREEPAGGRRPLQLPTAGAGLRLYALSVADLGAPGASLRLGALLDVQTEVHAAEAETLRRVLQVLSHELMNSLTPVTSLAETVADLLAGEPDEEAVTQAREAVAVIGRRADGLGQFVAGYRAAAQLPRPRLRAVDVSTLADDAVRLIRARPDARHVSITLERPTEPLIRVTDPDLIGQALSNLLINAVEAAVQSHKIRTPAVHLTLQARPTGARLEVCDTGPGVPEGEREGIFLPLTTTKAGGSGVGLHVARSAMRSLDGDVTWIRDADGAPGGRFVLIF